MKSWHESQREKTYTEGGEEEEDKRERERERLPLSIQCGLRNLVRFFSVPTKSIGF